MRVALYGRVSTPDQSVDRQIRELRAFAKARKWKVVREVTETASGAKCNRPLRQEILTMARKREVDAILVQAFDRWGRSVQDLVMTMAELESVGVAFVVPGHLDMTSPSGRMLAHFLGAVAEFERELISERVCSGLAHARSKGKVLGRPKVSSESLKQGLALLRSGLSYTEAANRAQVSVSTLLRAKRKSKIAG